MVLSVKRHWPYLSRVAVRIDASTGSRVGQGIGAPSAVGGAILIKSRTASRSGRPDRRVLYLVILGSFASPIGSISDYRFFPSLIGLNPNPRLKNLLAPIDDARCRVPLIWP